MTKEQELLRFEEFARNFPSNSYIGPWLQSVLPELRNNLSSDIIPYISVTEEVAEVRRLRDESRVARAELASVKSEAQTYAQACHNLKVEKNSLLTQLEELAHACLNYVSRVKGPKEH